MAQMPFPSDPMHAPVTQRSYTRVTEGSITSMRGCSPLEKIVHRIVPFALVSRTATTEHLAEVRVDVVAPLVAEALCTMLLGALQLQTNPSSQQMPCTAKPVIRKGSRRTPGRQLRETSLYRRQQASQQGPLLQPVVQYGIPVVQY